MNVGIFGVDPGGATGLAWGIFNPEPPITIEQSLRDRQLAGNCTVTGDRREQIMTIADTWRAFYETSVFNAQLPHDRIFLIVEDYIFTGGSYSGDAASISTSIIWGLEGYRMGRRDEWRKHNDGDVALPPMVLQSAGEAKGYATNQRLKDWGIWVKGRDHERSAWQHVAAYLHRYIVQTAVNRRLK